MSLLTNFQDLANTVKLALDRKADKSELATKADKSEIPSVTGKEDTANKVTSLSSSSTDTEYPSAKCVYDKLQNIPSMPSGTNTGDILVWNGTAWVAKAPSRLPNGYTEVEWIKGDGYSCLITGITPKSTTRIVADVTFEEFVEGASASMLYGATNGTYGFMFGKDERGFVSMVNNSYTWNVYGGGDNNRHTWDIQSGSQKIDNVQMSTSSFTTNGNNDFYLFGRHKLLSPDSMVNGKLYSFKIYEGNALIADYVPCYNFVGTIGVFDIINYKFLTNAGSGSFTKGADVN